MAQALVRYLVAQRTVIESEELPLLAGVFAIFGHGNVAGLGIALEEARAELPTYRDHNEQSMAHTAVAFAKATRRRRFMACTTSIGPGATNLVTAAAGAHINRLPVLLLPGDTFASRRPDPVLQQLEDPADPAVSVNDCLRPVSRYWARIERAEQLLDALPAAIEVLTDPARCGPATLALPQDVQTHRYDYPTRFFARRVHRPRRAPPDELELADAVHLIAGAERPLLIAGGGVHYADACERLARFAERRAIPVAVTQAGKSAIAADHPLALGGVGVTGTSAANQLAGDADLIVAIGTRLSDFTTASRTLFHAPLLGVNVSSADAVKHGGTPLVADAKLAIEALDAGLGDYRAAWGEAVEQARGAWSRCVREAFAPRAAARPSDAEVLGVLASHAEPQDVIVCAAGGLPGELHKLWPSQRPGDYHLEYGYSCMGYEIAGGLGVKLARPDAHVRVVVGDGSYLMLNTALATSVMLGCPLTVVVFDNGGFGCIDRLQRTSGGESFNNLFATLDATPPKIDFVAHARSLGAAAEKIERLDDLPAALARGRAATRTTVLVIETDPARGTDAGGAFWEVPSVRESPLDPAVKGASRHAPTTLASTDRREPADLDQR